VAWFGELQTATVGKNQEQECLFLVHTDKTGPKQTKKQKQNKTKKGREEIKQ
jgi:hypothetical protein